MAERGLREATVSVTPRPEPRSGGPARSRATLQRQLARACRRTLVALYAVLALVGLMYVSSTVLTFVVPVAAVLAAGVAGAVSAAREGFLPTPRRLVGPGLVGAGVIPFGAGIDGLGTVSAVMLLLMLACGIVLILVGVDHSAPADALAMQEGLWSGGLDDDLVRRALRDSPMTQLFAHWHASGRELARPGEARQAVVADFRALLLEELERRDAAGFRRWLAKGRADNPEQYLYDYERDVEV